MKESEAAAMMSIVAAVWPTPEMSSETFQAWSQMFTDQRFGLQDLGDAIRTLAETNRFRPSVAELSSIANELWRDRIASEAKQLPLGQPRGLSLTRFLHDRPDMAERVRALDNRPGPFGPAVREALGGLLRAGL